MEAVRQRTWMKDQPLRSASGSPTLRASRGGCLHVHLQEAAPPGVASRGARLRPVGVGSTATCWPRGERRLRGPCVPSVPGAAGFFLKYLKKKRKRKYLDFPREVLGRPVPGVHRVSSSVPPSAAPPCSGFGSEDALSSVRLGPLRDFHCQKYSGCSCFLKFILFKYS